MRYGVISDVHANGPALEATLDRLDRIGVDTLICAGDVVGYGPHPNECVDLIAGRDARCVAGNHELLVLGRLTLSRAGRLARETTGWTRAALRPDALAWLAGLPAVLRGPDVAMTHASLNDPTRYVRDAGQARAELAGLDQGLDRLNRGADAVLVLGHTHRQWLFGDVTGTVAASPGETVTLPAGERFLLNPGSVGQSRQAEPEPRARFAVLDTARRQVRFFAEPYDVRAARTALRRHGLPRSCIHVRPGLPHAALRRTGALLRAGRRAAGS